MKRYISHYIVKTALLMLPASLMLTSCEDWLDVKPSTEIESSDLFANEQGFKDALNGVYITISSPSMYGREMTYGFLDVIGSCYNSAGYNGTLSYAKNYDYKNASVEGVINSIWEKCFFSIANINELLGKLDAADENMFAPDNYNVIKGEAIALRAYLHFDLLRLFAKSYQAGADEAAIPYVTAYSFNVTPTSTVRETLGKIVDDLQKASELLRKSDPIVTGRAITAITDNGYLLDRQYHMNYFAVVATMARVYLYMNDYDNARRCANEVINSGKFSWTKVENIATASDAERDRTFTPEQIFALQMDNLKSYINGYVYGKYTVVLTISSYWLANIYPSATHATDWRYIYFITNKDVDSYGRNYTSTKLWQEGMNEKYVKRMPMIRLSEMYLILAECDIPNAAQQLNVIREHRGVTSEVRLNSEAELDDEITREYYREFYNEGQMFYHYKRKDANMMFGEWNFSKVSFNKEKYVLPMPSEEIEFGNRNQEDKEQEQ